MSQLKKKQKAHNNKARITPKFKARVQYVGASVFAQNRDMAVGRRIVVQHFSCNSWYSCLKPDWSLWIEPLWCKSVRIPGISRTHTSLSKCNCTFRWWALQQLLIGLLVWQHFISYPKKRDRLYNGSGQLRSGTMQRHETVARRDTGPLLSVLHEYTDTLIWN